MTLNTVPVFPMWLITIIVIVAVGGRVALMVLVSRRRGRGPGRRDWVRFGTSVLAIVCLAVAATRVGYDTTGEPRAQPARVSKESSVNVFFVVDRSANMLANDFGNGQGRDVGASADMGAIVQAYPKARFAMISYTDTAKLEWPISADVWSFIPFVAYTQPYGEPPNWEGSQTAVDITAPNPLLKEKLEQATSTYPGSTNLVFLFGSRTDTAKFPYDIPHTDISGGAVFGYGTPTGAPITIWPNNSAVTATPTLNEKALGDVAQNLGIAYHQRAGGPLPPEYLPPVTDQPITVESSVVLAAIPHRVEYYWLFAAAGAALFGVELFEFIGSRFRRKAGGRK